MPRTTVYEGRVERWDILGPDGRCDAALRDALGDDVPDARVVAAYRDMLVSRELDETAYRLQRSGRMGTYPQSKGSEAASIGAVMALRPGVDHIVPAYRENAGLFHFGLPMHQVLLHWMGDERGNQIDPALGISPICVAIGAQVPHATGIAWARKIENARDATDRIVLCFFGEGATSEGAFHDGLNFAAVLKVPVVFVCMNNGWAISVPAAMQTASGTFAQKAIGYGMPGVQADGNDLFAAYAAVAEAAARARSGEGPTLVELCTYRLADHTTVDDATRYRSAEVHAAGVATDPLVRTRLYLEAVGVWDETREAEAKTRAKAVVKEVVKAATQIGPPEPASIFDHQYAQIPPELVRQRDTRRTSGIGQFQRQQRLRGAPQASTSRRDAEEVAV